MSSFFQYGQSPDSSQIENLFNSTLQRYNLQLPSGASATLFKGLRLLNEVAESEQKCPFPLVVSVRSAHNHAKKLQNAFPSKPLKLGKCQQILADFYQFSKWEFFIDAVEKFVVKTFQEAVAMTAKFDISQALIEKNNDWKFLLRDFLQNPEFTFMGSMSQSACKMALAPAVVISKFLCRSHPSMLEKEEIKLLVVGAELVDALDGGRWYNVIPLLCGSQSKISTTIVAPGLFPEDDRTTPFYSRIPGRLKPASIIRADLERSGVSAADFDLVVLFHPTLGTPGQWLSSGTIRTLVSAQKPILLTSYHYDEYTVEQKLLEVFGFAAEADYYSNPFAVQASSDIHGYAAWGKIVWALSRHLPDKSLTPNAKLLEAADLITRMTAEPPQDSPGSEHGPCERVEMTGPDGRGTFIHVMDGHYVDPKSGNMYFVSGRSFHPAGTFSRIAISRIPEESAPHFDKLLWAARIKNNTLEEAELTAAKNVFTEEQLKNAPEILETFSKMSPEFTKEKLNQLKEKQVRTRKKEYHDIFTLLRNQRMREARNLIESEPSLIAITGPGGWTPMSYAVAHGDDEMVQWLLSRGIDLDYQDIDGYTYLMEAARRNFKSIVAVFIKHGANLDLVSHSMFTAAHIAASVDAKDVVEMLRAAGADFTKTTPMGLTPDQMDQTPGFVRKILSATPMIIP